MGGWGPPLRIAVRTARRAKGRTLLVAALIGVPVLAASWIGLTNIAGSPTGETLAETTIGTSDAQLMVSPYAKYGPQEQEPQLNGGEPAPPPGVVASRDAAKVDPLAYLPPGSTAARSLYEMGSAELRGPETNTSVRLLTGDGQSKLLDGTFKLDGGRMPGKPNEVAVSPELAKFLALLDGKQLKPGAAIRTADDQELVVVGLARTLYDPDSRALFTTPDNRLVDADSDARYYYLVDLPATADPDAVSKALLGNGMYLVPRANIIDPPPSLYGGTGDAGAVAVMALVIGFGILEIVLLAGTAFAVGARRQTRELGLVTATGGRPRDVRRIVLLQGLFAGILGAGGGLVIALLLMVVGRPLWEKMLNAVIVGFQVPWTTLLVIALLGLLAGIAAAVVPAISAGRQMPMAALAGRFTVTAAVVRIRRPALAMVVAGVVLTVVGSGWMAGVLEAAKKMATEGSGRATVTPTGPIALVLLGITATIIGLVWMLPGLVAKTAGIARIFPLSGRLALRDAARHRHRTGPATAAIMMAVAATAAIAFAAANSIAADAVDYRPESLSGDGIVNFGDEVPYSASTVEKVAELIPAKATYELGAVALRGQQSNGGYTPGLMAMGPAGLQGMSGYPVLVVDPDYIARFPEYGPKAAAALREGKVVVPDRGALNGSMARLTPESDYEGKLAKTFPGAVVSSPPDVGRLRFASFVSPETASKLGTVQVFQAQYVLEREPTDDEFAAVARVLGHDDLLTIEKGYQSPARLWLLGLIGAATVVTLLGVAISVSLSAAEGRADLATLAAVGAPPRRRRNLAAAQAWVLGQLGCLLGVGVGALYGYTAHAAFGSPSFVIPWQEIGAIVIVVPLFAGSLAWLMTRSRLPMVRRVD
ncbi:FtsX-like permease family protein [Kribbella italica]|uniref:Putative ABC transport system permease protein n=1 Tax=Kribbella italica TaxID=1540520 RepID=A0A7W9JC61_9ACTN|nr:ABC transporter permease [Kribbella italica]MBB5839467.1 putative ABC transport system permease protein [Kribbella italica]